MRKKIAQTRETTSNILGKCWRLLPIVVGTTLFTPLKQETSSPSQYLSVAAGRTVSLEY